MKFDDVLREIGEFGPYQKFVYLLVILPAITCGIHSVISVFIGGVPKHRCAIPGYENDTYAIQSAFHAELINTTIPLHLDEGAYVYDECSVFLNNTSHVTGDGGGTQLCDKWVYDRELFTSNAVITMDLVCSRKLYRSHIAMVFMAGKLIGSIVPGVLSDLFGRKVMLFAGCLLQLATGVATGWTTNYAVLAFLRFFNGVSASAVFVNAFTIGVELVGPSKRRWTGIVIEYMFALGEIILAGMAYLIRDWTYLQLAVSLPSALFIPYWWIVPESPRWLLSRGRHKEARAIVERIAKSNKRPIREQMFSDKVDDDDDTINTSDRLWHLFFSGIMLKRTIIIFFNWFVISMTYYGLSMNSGNLVGSIYLNFFLNCLMEFPALTICILLLDRTGRRALHAAMMIAGGVACTSSIFTVLYAGKDNQWLTTALALIGKLGVTAGFAIIYIISSEVFPTSLRNGGVGTGSSIARVGSMIAPYIADVGILIGGDFKTALPLITFGILSLTAGFLAFFLPETLNRKLPDSIAESKRFGRGADSIQNGDVVVRHASPPVLSAEGTTTSPLL